MHDRTFPDVRLPDVPISISCKFQNKNTWVAIRTKLASSQDRVKVIPEETLAFPFEHAVG